VSASGKKQIANQAQIVKTIREKDLIYKLDDPIPDIFKRMREVSKKIIENMQPNPYYLQVSHCFLFDQKFNLNLNLCGKIYSTV
jgi:hypothetical protein